MCGILQCAAVTTQETSFVILEELNFLFLSKSVGVKRQKQRENKSIPVRTNTLP
jgi:hypothetical protein